MCPPWGPLGLLGIAVAGGAAAAGRVGPFGLNHRSREKEEAQGRWGGVAVPLTVILV